MVTFFKFCMDVEIITAVEIAHIFSFHLGKKVDGSKILFLCDEEIDIEMH